MPTRSYQLTAKLVADHVGTAAVLCLDESAIGRSYQLHGSRPCQNERVTRMGLRAELANQPAAPIDPIVEETAVTVVTIRGPLEQRSQRRDSGCGGGWTDGYDAITERMQDALAAGDVVMVIDSPGGAVAGLQEAIKQISKAKADGGRHVVAYADESIGSAAYWLASSIADDIYIPDNGCVGSIGARGTHQSVAGMLKKAGVEVTHLVWPGEGKTAFDPSKPLSDEARERGQRDIDAIGQEFAAAVIATRPGVTLKQIIALDADSPRGIDAVKAGLADGVASLDEVVAMAITHAEEKTMAEEEKPKDDDETARAEEDEECEHCGGEGCEKCEGEDDEEEDDEDDEEDAQAPAAAPAARAPRATRSPRSLAELAGLQAGASMPAILSALTPLVGLARHVMAATETATAGKARGALKAALDDAAEAGALRVKLAAERRVNRARRRDELLESLVAAGIKDRGELFVYGVNETTGAKTKSPAEPWKSMKLSKLEGFVAAKLKSSAPRQPPAAPDAAVLERVGAANVTAGDRVAAAGIGVDPAKFAATRALLCNPNGASQGV